MSGTMITDGTGSSNRAKVTSDFRMRTDSINESRISNASHNELAFGVNLPLRTVTATGGRMLYIKNTSTTSKELHIDTVYAYWNGGSTNYNRGLEVSMFFGDSAPTGNNTSGTAGNLNVSSPVSAELDLEYWDEVGDGMTMSGGTQAFSGIITQGQTTFDLKGAVVMQPNDTVSINMKGEEVGEVGMNFLIYFEEAED
jgi:hypothetical protein